MARRGPAPIRLDIVGLDPRIFELCRQDLKSVEGARGKARLVALSERENSTLHSELAALPKDDLALYNRVVSIAIEFEHAYGRNVVVRVFQRSSNRVTDIVFGRNKKNVPFAESKPGFYINGGKVYEGFPKNFSELDEAVDKAFGRKLQAQ